MTRRCGSMCPRALALLLWVGPAWGAPCGKPDLLAAFPDDGAEGVPTNAVLSAKYSPTAAYLGERVELLHPAGTDEPVHAEWSSATGLLTVNPPEGLVEGDEYTIAWPRLRGIGTASLGRGRQATFTVGSGADDAAPRFEGLRGIEWDVDRERDDCTDALEERFVFDLSLGTASDDFPLELLALRVFQTSGPGISSATGPEPVLVTPLPSRGKKVRIARSLKDGEGRVCFAALVTDLAGRSSGGTDRERCADTIAPPFFYGCRVSTPGSRDGGSWIVLAGFLALTLCRRRGLSLR